MSSYSTSENVRRRSGTLDLGQQGYARPGGHATRSVLKPNRGKSSGSEPELGFTQRRLLLSGSLVGVVVALVPATAGTQRGLVIPFLRVSEFLVLLILVLALAHRRGKFLIAPRASAPLYAYSIIYSTLSAVNAFRRGGMSNVDLIQDTLGAWEYLFLFIAVINLTQVPGFFRGFVSASILFGTIHAAVGLLQTADVQAALDLATRVTGNDLIAHRPDWKAPRSVGLFPSWHAYGSYLALTATLGLAALLAKRDRKGFRALLGPLQLGFIGLGLLASLTFAPILIGFVGMLVLVRRKRVGLYLAGGVLLVGLLVTLTPLVDDFAGRIAKQFASTSSGLLPQTIWFRLQVWSQSWLPLIQDNLLTGYGRPSEISGAFAYAESMYILALLIGGLPLLVAFLAVLYVFWKVSAPDAFKSEADPARSALRATLPMLALGMLIHPYLVDAGVSQMVYILAGLAAARLSLSPASQSGTRLLSSSHQARSSPSLH